ncbi:MAG: transcription termination/antitermination protein NusA [Chlorobi bacterium]|nr:transcription termination/antitermination protein NusA [Chlorobiota bacterium]
MDNLNLIDTFANFKENKDIDRVTMMGVLEEVFRNMFEKQFGTSENFDFIINIDKGDFEIWRNREVVPDGEVEDPNLQVAISEVHKIDPDYEIGEEFADEVKLEDFGRRSILSLRQNLSSKILQLERESVYERYKNKIGDIVTGEVYQVWKKEMLVLDDEENEMILPRSEQIPSDFFRKGDTLRAVIERVEMKNNTPLIIISRTSPKFLERLFELEVPEIYDGLITIKKIVRVAGERAKVAVESYDERIDPVGACVGMKGARIHGIVRELRNENIDVINYSDNLKLYIQRALSPAKIKNIKIIEDEKRAEVFLDPEEVSKAIGKGGLNIKLAGKLVGYEIDVFRDIDETELEDDVDIMEFNDEIDEWVLETFKNIGCDTAKSVLNIPRDELIKRTDLEEETVDYVIKILKSEFEDHKE